MARDVSKGAISATTEEKVDDTGTIVLDEAQEKEVKPEVEPEAKPEAKPEVEPEVKLEPEAQPVIEKLVVEEVQESDTQDTIASEDELKAEEKERVTRAEETLGGNSASGYTDSTHSGIRYSFFSATNPREVFGRANGRGSGSSETNIVIPSTVSTWENRMTGLGTYETRLVENIRVRAINERAFEADGLKSLILSENVEVLGVSSFRDNVLTQVTFPNSLRIIRDSAFNRNLIPNINLPNNLESIEANGLAENRLTSIILPISLTNLGFQAFGSNQIVEVTLPGHNMNLGDALFRHAPLKNIYVTPIDSNGTADVEIMKNQLTPSVLEGVSERTILRSKSLSYTPATSLTSTKLSGESIKLEADIVGYQLNNLTDRIWQTYSPNNIKWFKDGKEIPGQTDAQLNLSNLQVWDSGTYYAMIGTERYPDIKLSVEGFTFTYTGTNATSTATVTGYSGTIPSNLVIPSTAINKEADWTNSSPVKNIGTGAFESQKLESVTIPNSIETIGAQAFQNNNLTSLTIQNGVKSIGGNAFRSNQLANISIPNSVTSLGASSFRSNRIKTVSIPSSISTIQESTFMDNQLMNVTIPSSVTTIGNNAFSTNSLTSVTIPSSVTTINAQAFSSNTLNEVTLTDATMTMGAGIFNSTALKNILVIPVDSSKRANIDAVKDRLTSNVIGTVSERTILRSKTTRYTTQTALTTKKLSGESTQFELDTGFQLNNITSRTWQAYAPGNIKWFKDGKELLGQATTQLNLSNLQASDSGIYHAMVGTERYPDINLTVEGFTFTFQEEEGVREATVTGYSGTIPTNLVIPDTATNTAAGWSAVPVKRIGSSAFSNKGLQSVKLPKELYQIAAQAFQENNLKSIAFPESIGDISKRAFYNNQLTEVTILTEKGRVFRWLGEEAFMGNKIEAVTIPDNLPNNVASDSTVNNRVFEENPLKTITVVNSSDATKPADLTHTRTLLTATRLGAVTERTVLRSKVAGYTAETGLMNTKLSGESIQFETDSGYQLNNLTNRVWQNYTPANLKWFKDGKELVGKTSRLLDLQNLQLVDSGVYHATVGTEVYSDIKLTVEGFTFSFDGTDGNSTATVTGYSGSVPTDLVIPSEALNSEKGWKNSSIVTTIAGHAKEEAGAEWHTITSLNIPDSITVIGENAFSNNSNLANLQLGQNVEVIGEGAFTRTAISSLTLPSSLKEVGPDAFGSMGMTELIISPGITTLWEAAFRNNELTQLVIPSSVTVIEENAFDYNKLDKLIIPNNVTSVGMRAFSNNQLADVKISTSLKSLNTGIFSNNQLTKVTIPESITIIESNAFANNQLTEVEFSSNVKSIGPRAFAGNQLTELILHTNIQIVYLRAFENNQLAKVTLSDSLRIINPESEVFNNNPLKEILVFNGADDMLPANVDKVKNQLTPSDLGEVTERTILRSKELQYVLGTDLTPTVMEGEQISFEVQPEYQLDTIVDRNWETRTLDDIQWYKGDDVLSGEVSTSLELVDIKEVERGEYQAKRGNDEYPIITLAVDLDTKPLIPPVEPDGPEILPEGVNPNIEALSLRYVSPLNFGTHEFSQKDEVYYSENLVDTTGQSFSPMVVVQDMRPENQRFAWELYVSLEKELKNGAQITLNPYADEEKMTNLAIDIAQNKLIVGEAPKKFAGTLTTSNPSGIVSIGMSSKEDPGVELLVPEGTGIGKYSGTMKWELVSGPPVARMRMKASYVGTYAEDSEGGVSIDASDKLPEPLLESNITVNITENKNDSIEKELDLQLPWKEKEISGPVRDSTTNRSSGYSETIQLNENYFENSDEYWNFGFLPKTGEVVSAMKLIVGFVLVVTSIVIIKIKKRKK